MMTIKEFMNKLKFLVVVFTLTFTISCGQQKRYVSYKIKQGETMRDVANRLNIKTKDLLNLNPDVGRKPASNTVIIIPNVQQKQPNYQKETISSPESEEAIVTEEITVPVREVEQAKDTIKIERIVVEYETHTVQPKETVYSLTRKYGISKIKLLQLNPEYPDLKDNKLSIGQVLKVKATETKTYVSLEDELKNYVTHTVKSKETVYSLTRFYNISKEELVTLNTHLPNLKNNNLRIGDILKIRPISEELISDKKAAYLDNLEIGRTVKLALLLPFKAKDYDSVNATDIFKGRKGIVPNMVTDFYMGAEIAIDSLINQGIDIQVKVFDTGNKGKNIRKILTNNNLEDEDVIIGPFYSDKAKMVASSIKTPVIFPHFSNKQHTFSSSRLVKTSPDKESYINELISYLKAKYKGETIFVVGDGKPDSNSQVSTIVNGLKEHDAINEINILKPEKGYIKKGRFTDKMKPKSHCWVIMTSDDKVAVADALNSMVVLPENVTAQVFAVNKNKAYDKIDNNKLARIEFAYITNNFIDDSDELTSSFNQKYRKKNHSLPSEYATKGFDVTYDILIRLASGNSLNKTFNQGTSIRVGNKFNYDKSLFGTTSNNGLFIVKYNKDLTLERLR